MLIGAGGLAAVLALVVAYLVFARSAAGPQGALLGYRVVSDSSVEVRFEVSRPVGTKAVCLIRARDAGGAEVGRAEVPIPTGGPRTVRLTHLLTTTGRANTGEVADCIARP